MGIRINATTAFIGMKRTPGTLNLTRENPAVDIETKMPKVEIKSEQIKVTIDQSQQFSESGLKSNSEITDEGAQLGAQEASKGVARIVDQGNQLGDVHKGFDAIPEQANQNAFHLYDKDWTIENMPKSRPKIDFVGGEVDVKVNEGTIDNKTRRKEVDSNYQRGKIEIYMRQKAKLTFSYDPSSFNMTV